MHSLLARQLRRMFQKPFEEMPAEWQDFLKTVDNAYSEFDRDRALLERSMELSSQELNQANRELRVSLQEVTEKKQLEGMLFQSEKMAAVGQLAAGVAHEINNPLAVVLGFAQSMQSHLPPESPFQTHLSHIEREAKRCKTLVQGLLTFSRASSIEEKGMVELNSTVEEALTLVLAKSKCTSIELVKRFANPLAPLLANRSQIQQVVINLCNNAIDAMPDGGRLTIGTEPSPDSQNKWQILTISDTGIGIPADIRSRIFDPFFTTKEVGKGTGLGLSLVYEIIRRHNGEISVESKTGEGSTFSVFWPCIR